MKNLKDKLKEFAAFIVCIAFLLGAAHMTGLLTGFSTSDFEKAYKEISGNIEQKNEQSGLNKYANKGSSLSTKTSSYKFYATKPIPKNVLAGAETSGSWTQLFNSNKKIIFYIYDQGDTFNQSILNFVENEDLSKVYTIAAYTTEQFNNMRLGTVGPSKICNSIEECNFYREKAANYSLLTEFLKRCGSTICIFKPQTKQYTYLKKRDLNKAQNIIETMQNW